MSKTETPAAEARTRGLRGFSAASAIEVLRALANEIVPVVALYIAPSGMQAVVRGLVRVTPNGSIVVYPQQADENLQSCIAVPLPEERDRCNYRKRQDLDDESGAIHFGDSELLLTIRYERSREMLVLLVNRLYGAIPAHIM